jgi:predicted Rossmann fold nucleotide-binding protein DprA/Smf involved in DNA uptake
MPKTITITGTRATSHREQAEYHAIFAKYLAPFARDHTSFYIGGAVGIDTETLLWLADTARSSITVVVPGTAARQPAIAQHAIASAQRRGRLAGLVELKHDRHPSAASYQFRNRWMVDRSEFVIAFPRGEDLTRGTWYTANYAAKQGKPRLIIPLLWSPAVINL